MKSNFVHRISICLFIILIYKADNIHAEEVLLTNGSIISGKIIGQSVNDLEIQTDTKTMNIPKGSIIKVQYKKFTPEQKDLYIENQKKKRQEILAKKREAGKKEKERIEKLTKENKSTQIVAEPKLEESIPSEKELEAKDVAERASALRELVGKGLMEKPDDEPISYWDFAWRSLVFPGWGHFTIDRPVIGSLYMASSIALLSGVYDTRRVALNAQRENIRQVETNFLFSIQPNLAPLEIRTLYSYNSNAQAAFIFQKKVDNYHNSLVAFGTLYGIQFLHIVYNAIAWENGLLIVKRDMPKDEDQKFHPIFSNHSELTADGRRETVTKLGVTYVF
jgi:hypothetical protein